MPFLESLLAKVTHSLIVQFITRRWKNSRAKATEESTVEGNESIVLDRSKPAFGRRGKDSDCLKGRSRVFDSIDLAILQQRVTLDGNYSLLLFRVLGSDNYKAADITRFLRTEIRGEIMVGRFTDFNVEDPGRETTCFCVGIHGEETMKAGILLFRVADQMLDVVGEKDLQASYAQASELTENAKHLYDAAHKQLVPIYHRVTRVAA